MSSTPTWAEVIGEAMRSALHEMRVALPARVEAYDAAAQTVDVQPMVKEVGVDADGNKLTESLPAIPGVPVCMPRGGGYFVAVPIKKGDFVLLVFSDRSIDQWRAKGSEAAPGDLRTHDLSDAVAIPGVFPATSPLADASASDLVIGRDGSGPLLTMKDDGSILIGRSATKEAARKGDSVEAKLTAALVAKIVAPAGTAGGPCSIEPPDVELVLAGTITAGSSKIKIGD